MAISRHCWKCRGIKCLRITKIFPQRESMLDQDHYGLEKVKERVLEFLAVRTLTRKGRQSDPLSGGPAGNR